MKGTVGGISRCGAVALVGAGWRSVFSGRGFAMARTPEDRHVGDNPLTELLSPALVLDRVPAAVSVWDRDMTCRFGSVRSAGLTRPHERHGPVEGATLSEWLPDQETYATYFAHAVAALDGRVEVFDAVFPEHDSLRHAHVRMDPVVAPSLQDASCRRPASRSDCRSWRLCDLTGDYSSRGSWLPRNAAPIARCCDSERSTRIWSAGCSP